MYNGNISDSNSRFLQAQLNGDSSASNYNYQANSGQNGSSLTNEGIGTNPGLVVGVVGPGSISSFPTTSEAWIAGAGSANHFTTSRCLCFGPNTSLDNLRTDNIGGVWRNTAVVTSMTLLPAVGSFLAGTRFVLLGRSV